MAVPGTRLTASGFGKDTGGIIATSETLAARDPRHKLAAHRKAPTAASERAMPAARRRRRRCRNKARVCSRDRAWPSAGSPSDNTSLNKSFFSGSVFMAKFVQNLVAQIAPGAEQARFDGLLGEPGFRGKIPHTQ